VQEIGGIRPAGTDQAMIEQGGENVARACRIQLGPEVAKVAAIGRNTLAGKKSSPVLIHNVLPVCLAHDAIIAASNHVASACHLFKVIMRTFKIVLLLVILAFLGIIVGTSWFTVRHLPMRSDTITFSIPAGASLRSAAQIVENAGVDMPAWQLELLGRAKGRSSKIKAGSYEIESGLTAMDLLDKLTRGDVLFSELVLVEGKNFRQLRAALNEHPDLSHDSLKLSDQQILKGIGAKEPHPEGLFFPDTYLFAKGTSDLDVLRRAYKAMQPKIADAWAKRESTTPLKSPYELLILASIVEKETGLAADRPQIAAVFINRLRRNMLMQSDPTVIYGIGEKFDGNLRKVDLQTDTPWNTYTRVGLPPTPIAVPGVASLLAAAKPPPSDMLYFVARGDGSSEFSASLDEHNSAVAKYQKR
jgi:UPF0755 protein